MSPLFFFALLEGQGFCGLDELFYRKDEWNMGWTKKRRWLRLPVNIKSTRRY